MARKPAPQPSVTAAHIQARTASVWEGLWEAVTDGRLRVELRALSYPADNVCVHGIHA